MGCGVAVGGLWGEGLALFLAVLSRSDVWLGLEESSCKRSQPDALFSLLMAIR